MSQARTGFFGSLSNCLNKAKNILFNKVTAGTVLITSALVLDFVCDQEIQHETIDWTYYSETPSRIIWLLLSGLLQGMNLSVVINSFKQEAENDAANRLPAQKILAGSILYSTSMAFANFSLTAQTQPIIGEQWGYIAARACINGSLAGTMMSGGNYLLNKLNFSIRPFTFDHVKFVSAGIILAMMQELLNFVCDQMMKQNSIKWDALTTPIEPFVWEVIVIATTGTIYGLTKIGFDKYANPEDGSMNVFNKILLPVMAVCGYAGTFIQSSLTMPINAENAEYIAAKSLSSIPGGVLSGAIYSIAIGLFRQRQSTPVMRTPLLAEGPENTSTIPRMRAGSVNNV